MSGTAPLDEEALKQFYRKNNLDVIVNDVLSKLCDAQPDDVWAGLHAAVDAARAKQKAGGGSGTASPAAAPAAAPAAGYAAETSVYTTEERRSSYPPAAEVLAQRLANPAARALVLDDLLPTFVRIAAELRRNLVHKHGSRNSFGEEQLSVDVLADGLLFDMAAASPRVAAAASEEKTTPVSYDRVADLHLMWDPLDGSSIVDNNWSVGTIVGVWPCPVVGSTGRMQLTALVAQYGPRLTVLCALDDGVCELTHIGNEWVCSRENIRIAPATKIFSPANLRCAQVHPGYASLVEDWMKRRLTLRYCGGMVPDICQQFTKGQGVFANPTHPEAPAKLRVCFEAAPFALLVERAGGQSCEGARRSSILDLVIKHEDQRTGICCGSSEEVQKFIQHCCSGEDEPLKAGL